MPGIAMWRMTESPDSAKIKAGEPMTAIHELPRKRKVKSGTFIAFTLVLALLGLLAWGLMKVQAGPLQSGIAPDFDLVGFDGRRVTLSDLRGQVVMINFWASWCIPCRQEAPYLEQTWRNYQDQGVVFIGVAYADTPREAQAFIDEFGITYLNGPDLGTRISQAYYIRGIPETFFVDKNGKLRGVHIGPMKYPQLEEKIDALLAEPYYGE
jgi:cytochrome c biogenesis protein CcmG, thiol:disulfide interchange protein DsbE